MGGDRWVTCVRTMICSVLLVWGGTAVAQTHRTLDQVLAEPNLTYGSAAYLALVASGSVSSALSRGEAFEALVHLGPVPSEAIEYTDEITLGDYSHILMVHLGFDGGLLYRIAPGSRYAARWIRRARIAEPPVFPGMKLSGNRAVRILDRAIRHREGERLW